MVIWGHAFLHDEAFDSVLSVSDIPRIQIEKHDMIPSEHGLPQVDFSG